MNIVLYITNRYNDRADLVDFDTADEAARWLLRNGMISESGNMCDGFAYKAWQPGDEKNADAEHNMQCAIGALADECDEIERLGREQAAHEREERRALGMVPA